MQKQVISELQECERKFRFIAENTGDVIWILDIARRRFTYVSPSVEDLRGYTPEEVMAQPLEAALTPESAEYASAILRQSINRWDSGDHSQTLHLSEIAQPHKNGHIVHTEIVAALHADAAGKPVAVIGISRKLNEHRESEEAIRKMAFYDPLTQLPNRRLLLDRIPQLISRARRDQDRLAVLFIDLDRFKPVNDEFGHETGDWLLRRVTMRLKECLRETDTAARMGGDEFVVVLSDIQTPLDAINVAEKICLAIKQPFTTENHIALNISCSVGISLFPDHGETAENLIRLADRAMYAAKHAGRNRVELCSSSHPAEHIADTANGNSFVRLTWKPGFACGNPWIDQQHRELFVLANRLLDEASAEDFDGERFNSTFDTLVSHVVQHFSDEEEILENRHYEHWAEHAQLHQSLIAEATALRHRADEKNIAIGELVTFLVNEVVAHHMLSEDRKFFPLFSGPSSATETSPEKTQ